MKASFAQWVGWSVAICLKDNTRLGIPEVSVLSGELEEVRDCLAVGCGVFKTQHFFIGKINTFECLHSENAACASLMRSSKANSILTVMYSLWLEGRWPACGQTCRSRCAWRLFCTPQEKLCYLVIEVTGWGESLMMHVRENVQVTIKIWGLQIYKSVSSSLFSVVSISRCSLPVLKEIFQAAWVQNICCSGGWGSDGRYLLVIA